MSVLRNIHPALLSLIIGSSLGLCVVIGLFGSLLVIGAAAQPMVAESADPFTAVAAPLADAAVEPQQVADSAVLPAESAAASADSAAAGGTFAGIPTLDSWDAYPTVGPTDLPTSSESAEIPARSTEPSDRDEDAMPAMMSMMTWVQAMLTDNYAMAESVYLPVPGPERSSTLRSQVDGTREFLHTLEKSFGERSSFKNMRTFPTDDPRERDGLVVLYFVESPICFEVPLRKYRSFWYVLGWTPLTGDVCAGMLERLQ